MQFSKTVKREIEVAFSKHAQPVWLRVLKYIILLTLLYFFWKSKLFWIVFFIVCVLAFGLHFWVRYKTNGWTKDYGLWKYRKDKPKNNAEK
jgi:hypothetical protein